MSLSDLTTTAFVINFLVGIVCYRRIKDRPLRWLVIYLGVALLPEAILLTGTPYSSSIIRVSYCLLFPIEYAIYTRLFARIGDKSPVAKRWLNGSAAGLVLYSAYKLTTAFDQQTIASDVFLGMSILTLMVALLYFLAILRSNQVLILSREPVFWIATGLLFFYTGNLIATGFYHRLYAQSASLARNLYYLNYSLNILRCVLVSVAFVVAATANRDE